MKIVSWRGEGEEDRSKKIVNAISKKARLYIVLTFTISWLFVLFLKTSNYQWRVPSAYFVIMIFMFFPLLSVLIISKKIYNEEIKQSLGISFSFNKWFFIAGTLPLVLAIITFFISLSNTGVKFAPSGEGYFDKLDKVLPGLQYQLLKDLFANHALLIFAVITLTVLLLGFTVNAALAFGEEIGWRGFLIKEFKPMGFWKSSLLIGALWGIWHAPIIMYGHNYPGYPRTGIAMMTLLCILLSPIIGYVRLKAKSVIAAAILHGAFNATPIFFSLYIKGGNVLTVGQMGASGIVALCIANIGLFIYDRYFSAEPIMTP